MEKKIYALATHYGDHMLDYERFFYENRALLAEMGIAYPWLSVYQSDFLWQVGLSAKINELSEENHIARQELLKELNGRDSLLLVAPIGPLATSFPTLLEFFKSSPDFSAWAHAKVNLVWLACERSREIEGAARFNMPHDTTAHLYQNSLSNFPIYLENIERLLNCATSVEILPDSSTNHLSENVILGAMGLVLPEKGRLPLRQTPPYSREECFALAKMSQIFPEKVNKAGKLPAASSHTLMPPEYLQKIHETTAQPLERLAEKHGVKISFPEPEKQTAWQPFAPPGQDFCKQVYEAALASLAPEDQDVALRALEVAWKQDWLCEKPREYASALREKFNLPMHPTPLLSVLTLTKNHEKYIGECIESVLAQKTDFPVRHIILDDCSTDGTPGMVWKYARKYPSIYPIFMQWDREQGDNVKALFSACSSRYAALCDGDDFFTDPLKLQKQTDFLEAHPDCSICFHPVEKRYEDGSPSEYYPPVSMLPGDGKRHIFTVRDLLMGNMIQTNSAVYRWRFQNGLPAWFDGTLTPGDWYWHLLHAETGFICFLPEVMSVYRRHASSLFASAEKSHVEHRVQFGLEELRLYDALDRHFKRRYRQDFQRLANGVFADYLRVFVETGKDDLLNGGIASYPLFAKNFLADLKLVSGHKKQVEDVPDNQ